LNFGEGSSASCSVESVLSNISLIDREDAADISDGSKGWIVDSASNKCMGCSESFRYPTQRKHHCRNCGRIFCGPCTTHTFFRVNENRGENVRVCNECYALMTASRTRASDAGELTPPAQRSQNRDSSTGKSPTFLVGNADGQTVCG
uniref:FYVE-type domain-containing protein n=1 Tax=Gongylonema pulchrum TaxID=637853 RepID=A0A183DA87_9BILA